MSLRKKQENTSVATDLKNYYINYLLNRGGRDCPSAVCLHNTYNLLCVGWNLKNYVNFFVLTPAAHLPVEQTPFSPGKLKFGHFKDFIDFL